MRLALIRDGEGTKLAARSELGYFTNGALVAVDTIDRLIEQGPDALLQAGRDALSGNPVDLARSEFLPPLARSSKIMCVGLNYRDHSAESGFQQPDYPTLFMRSRQSLVAHGTPIIRPLASTMLDYEGELVAIIGTGGRHISRADALGHVAAYTLFNDASVRDYQHRTPQWTVGKNFDGTGAIGPDIVTADELPLGGAGLGIETILNGNVVQAANTSDLVFDVATLVEVISAAMTLVPGDMIVTGTPAGVGHARKPPLYMKAGDRCEVRIERVGALINPVIDEVRI